MRINLSMVLFSIGLVSCISTQRERQMRQDIFALQTKLDELEKQSEERGRVSEDSLGKKMAGTNNQLEKLTVDLSRMRGEMDALRIGVQTGQLPDADPEKDSSLLQKLTALSERMSKIESSQSDILDSLNNQPKKEKTLAAAAAENPITTASNKPPTFKEIMKSFEKKRFKQVIEGGAKLEKALKGAELQELNYAMAESLYKTSKYREAALKFNEFIDSKPAAAKLPHAKMRMGDCFRLLGDQATAKLYYQELLDKFPDSNEASKAKERLSASKSKRGAHIKANDKKGPMHAKDSGKREHRL